MELRTLGVALTALGLLACGASPLPPPPPPPQGTLLDVQASAELGPRIPDGAIFAAGDLTTLRSLIDAADGGMANQLGGAPMTHECLAPYTNGRDVCWPDLTSQSGRSYLALDVQGGFCTTEDGPPRLAVSGTNIVLQLAFADLSGCRLNGSLALPSASLLWFRSDKLQPGLYSVSYVLEHIGGDTYRSESTYLSVPSPAPGVPADLDQEATTALTTAVGLRRGIFSVSRVDGSQLAGLCGETVAGPAYLVTYETNPPRQMTVALAGPTPRTCATSRIGP